MPAISFSVFREKLENGTKAQTIRKLRKHPIKVGDKLFIYWKKRSKNNKLLGVTECTWTRTTYLRNITNEEAILDGFDGRYALWQWFNKTYKPEDTIKAKWRIIRFKPLTDSSSEQEDSS